jgi:hypothetical protein
MPCDPSSSLSQAISGAYAAYYKAPNENAFTEASSYLGAIKANTLVITTGVNASGVFSDFMGPDTPIDYILTPKHDMISFTLIEINRNAVKKLIYPYSTSNNGALRDPGRSGEKPGPGRLQSSYEGRLRLVPMNGNLRYWDDDLNFTDVTNTNNPSANPSGLSIRDYFHVGLDPDNEMEENYTAQLDEMPVRLMARLCKDTVTNQWRTHQFVPLLTSPLT